MVLTRISRRLNPYIYLVGVLSSQTIFGGAFENEPAAVEAAIKTRHKAKLGKVEAIVGFAFTVGCEETETMTAEQVTPCDRSDEALIESGCLQDGSQV